MSLPTVTLCMIVKNEKEIIRECLESVYKYVDRYDITDTGSTDGTQDIIRNFFEEKGIPGEVYQSDWKGFGDHGGKQGSRTESLRNCDGKAQYAWVIDADDYIHIGDGGFSWPEEMDADSYVLRIQRGDFIWWRNQVFKTGTDVNWKYVGVLHEYADCDKKEGRHSLKVEGDYYIVARTMGHERNANIDPVAKYSKDAEILEEALKEEPNNHRYLFYLAQSYFDSQQWEKAFKAYQNRVIAGGWEEEQWYSAYRMAIIASIEKRHWPEVHQLYLQAYNLRPNRAEPLWQLARIHRQERNEPRIAYLYAKTACEIKYPENDILFISSDVYHWQALEEFAAAAYYCHDFLRGYNACVELLKSPHVPETEKARIQQNTEVYKQKLMEMQMQVQQAQQQQAQDQEKQREELLKRREKQKQSKKKRQKIKR